MILFQDETLAFFFMLFNHIFEIEVQGVPVI